jgi:transglutaminase-like putative cysteine protease
MHYAIVHITRFSYDVPVTESVMEVRMQPRNEGTQMCHRFELHTVPRARVLAYRDASGNAVHHFNIPAPHVRLVITARSSVEMLPMTRVPEALPIDTWQAVDSLATSGEFWEYRQPSRFTHPTTHLADLARVLGVDRQVDPLTCARRITTGIFERFEYVPRSTRVDSPIDEALAAGRGVCQDFAHVMIALIRGHGLPCRYVSGYLPHGADHRDRSEAGATHAWVEVWLPTLGWVGFDPTNDGEAHERHVRVAIGRDYADVPPTRGIYKGEASSDLAVAVKIGRVDAPPPPLVLGEPVWATRDTTPPARYDEATSEVQQQQQQQQQ